jgi:hypothetical protein
MRCTAGWKRSSLSLRRRAQNLSFDAGARTRSPHIYYPLSSHTFYIPDTAKEEEESLAREEVEATEPFKRNEEFGSTCGVEGKGRRREKKGEGNISIPISRLECFFLRLRIYDGAPVDGGGFKMWSLWTPFTLSFSFSPLAPSPGGGGRSRGLRRKLI